MFWDGERDVLPGSSTSAVDKIAPRFHRTPPCAGDQIATEERVQKDDKPRSTPTTCPVRQPDPMGRNKKVAVCLRKRNHSSAPPQETVVRAGTLLVLA
jgi:hypothetical protein